MKSSRRGLARSLLVRLSEWRQAIAPNCTEGLCRASLRARWASHTLSVVRVNPGDLEQDLVPASVLRVDLMAVARIHSAVADLLLRRSRRMLSPTVLATGLLAACGGGDLVLPEGGGPASIRVVNGDGQSGPAGRLLAAPIVVEVTNVGDAPVEGATVQFALTAAGTGAEVQPATATTDAGRS